ncbi:MAG: hypothetical protein ACD_79C01306G0004 [uncultured bacterium]|nr:MAG: hypothetical protein ACD_79C01306G0004 [uncultured bacterium]
MLENNRNLFISSKLRNFFIFYVLFSILVSVLFLGWEIFIEIIASSMQADADSLNYLRGFPTVIKVSLLLLWGMFSFLISYIYLDAKFMGIFSRMDELFNNMINDDSLTLSFRKNDNFDFLAESFSKMQSMFLNKILHRKKIITELRAQISNLPNNVSEQVLKDTIKIIDNELSN